MKLLQIDSSILGDNSVSRILSAGIVARQRDLHPAIEVTYRDLAATPLAHLSGAHLGAWHGAVPEDSVTKADVTSGDAALAELFAADIIVIGAPMYNFAVPTVLKAWIDRLLIAGRSFQYTEHGPKSLLPPGKKLFIASARGGVYTAGNPAAPLDHQETYLQAVFSFLGITDVTVIRAEGIAMGPEIREQAIAGARAQIDALAA